MTLMPWNPLSWLARSRLAKMQEMACDDWAVHSTGSDVAYAESLVQLSPSQRTSFSLAAVRSHPALRHRLERILSGHKRSPHQGLGWTCLVSFVMVLAVSVVSFAQPQSSNNPAFELRPGGTARVRDEEAYATAVREARQQLDQLEITKQLDTSTVDALARDFVHEGMLSLIHI